MAKSSEELAVEIVSKIIESKQIYIFNNDENILSSSEVICNLLKDIYKTLKELDK